MKWTSKDMDMYLQAMEYVDTILLPLNPISFGNEMKQFASFHDFIGILAMEIEKQLKGRLLLMPSITYVQTNRKKQDVIQPWIEVLEDTEFKHIFWLTSDPEWKTYETELDGQVILVASQQLEGLEVQKAKEIMNEQVKKVLEVLKKTW